MNSRSGLITRSLILAGLLMPAMLHAQGSMQLEKQFATGELSTPIASMQFSLFDSNSASVPLASQTYFSGEWQIASDASSRRVSVEFTETETLPAQGELWLEVESGGMIVGERELVRAVAPGITFALGNTLNMSTNQITNLGAPVTGTDAATMQYVLDQVATITGDDLGDHTAIQNILLNGFWLSPDGTNAGLFIDPAGQVGIGMDTPAHSLDVLGSINASTAVKVNGNDVLTSESDPKVGALLADKWCSSDGLVVNCDADLPGLTETDPTVPETIKDGIDWTELSSVPAGFADGVDNEGVTTETDPTVLASVKDGVSWAELSGIPSGFSDGVDNEGVTTETDPTVIASVKDGVSWSELSAIPPGFSDNIDDVGLTSESDPTVPAAIKDGIDWTELSGIPAGFADDVDDVGLTSEDDPEIGSNTTNYVPVWDGTALVTGSLWDDGRIGIGTETPLGNLHVDGVDGVLFEDTVGSGAIPVEGAGVRMMWYPGKGAFRAGSATDTSWNDSNIGTSSFATGEGTEASGDGSTAIGTGTVARSYAEVAVGMYNTDYVPLSTNQPQSDDRLFVIGDGSLAVPHDAMVVLKNGNTGFGISNPAYDLDVTGTINASTAIKINGTDVLTSFSETDPTIVNLTADKWCTADGTGTEINCTTDQPVVTESDPQVDALTANKWCTADGTGTEINCTTDQPVVTESDPQVDALTANKWCTADATGSAIDCATTLSDAETDPTVPASIKDGITWLEVSSRPAGLDDGDDLGVTSITAGTGLDGGTITTTGTLGISVPLTLSGSDTSAIFTGTNSGTGYGIEGSGTNIAGYFHNLNTNSYVYAATALDGIHALGNQSGGYFKDLNDSGYAYVGNSHNGINAYGNTTGGYFKDLDNSGYAYVGYGDNGISAYGNARGGYFEDLDNSGIAELAVGNVGVKGSGSTEGGNFEATNPWAKGVVGVADNSTAVANYGGHFTANATQGRGVYAKASSTGDVVNYGGYFESKSNLGYGGYGTGYIGLAGFGNPSIPFTYGVFGKTDSKSTGGAYGVYGEAVAASGSTAAIYGVYGKATGTTTGSKYAGYFSGNVHVAGTLSKSAGSFKIDHPLDPENRTLSHSFVESPDMMNIYNGNVILDGYGEAVVEMPEWFEALNREFRYQLTTIGGFAPVYVAEKIAGNTFKIAGGNAGMEVSWQVTGIRHDPYAESNRIPVEEDKSENERGSYLNPAAYGLSDERSAERARNPSDVAGFRKQASL